MKPSEGKPAEFDNLLVRRRVRIVETFGGFLASGLRILDFGCGNGATMFEICDRVLHVDGIDISEANRQLFEQKKQERNAQNCAFILQDVQDIDGMEVYDRVISFEVLEHVPDDLQAALKIYQLLKKGGEAAISVPNKWWVFETHGANLPILPWNRVPFFSWLPRVIHEKFAKARIYTRSRITTLLRRAGFVIVEAYFITAPMDVVKNLTIKKALRKYIFKNDTTQLPILSTSILVHVKKI